MADLPASAWRRVSLDVPARKFKNPRVFEQSIVLAGAKLRQLFVVDLGHEQPTILLTNDRDTSHAKLLTRYAQRMLIENALSDAVRFFHMDALSSAVGMKVDFDMTLLVIASGLYRLLAPSHARLRRCAGAPHLPRPHRHARRRLGHRRAGPGPLPPPRPPAHRPGVRTAQCAGLHPLVARLLLANVGVGSADRARCRVLVQLWRVEIQARLLDLTTNPLIALYFACKSHDNATAEVIVFKIKNTEIKFFDSDTVSCLASLARLQKQDKDQIDFALAQAPFNATLPITKLLHFIREEKSFFVEKIVPGDLQRIVCVRGKMTNNRIISQSGAFLIFGLGATLAAGHPSIAIERVSINKNDKQKILGELDALNINESTVFPYIENSAKYISRKYGA